MDILTAVLAVFSAIGEWIPEAITNLVPMFYTAGVGGDPGKLTFLGVLSVAGLSFSVIFLCISLIQNFLHFRG